MINLNIVCVGELKEKFWKEAINEYSKRISAFANLKIYEVKESEYGISEKDILVAKQKEAERLKKFISGHTIALEIAGDSYSSEGLADHIQKLANKGNSTITFVIGGSYGLDSDFSSSLNEQISFSDFTFPHQLMRVILVEQIYRALTILNNKTYHK